MGSEGGGNDLNLGTPVTGYPAALNGGGGGEFDDDSKVILEVMR